ncbi:hypothetical protein BOVMAS18_06680 [Streptococcus uberis]|uniref:glycosyltransferase n=1 Tax=Streptococcus uberis TaxID=1349 RepID=UPI0006203AC6|nr:glycosyltransferase [Streptococcus uberis]KKF49212.1 glycosyl transferase family 1 [Streptococcus uberis C8329]KKF60082.1 glycosyl transferase family 1 [Streptococcus uberis B362]MCK1164585.1 glycosyltransferase [Streptococcus uberis]
MKIVQICLTGQYNPTLTYQDNMFAKYYTKLGLDVYTIATPYSLNENGKEVFVDTEKSIIENQGTLIRLSLKKPIKFNKKFRRYNGLFETLEEISPDILYIHGCQFLDIRKVVKYLKLNRNIKVYVDNHSDFSNSARNFLSKNILHKIIWKKCAQSILPYTNKFYGVLPSRVEFLKNIYDIPSEKIELLVLGSDDEIINKVNDINLKKQLREKFGIKEKDFLIVTGGKIDSFKKQTLLLMEAIKFIDKDDIKLLIFGSIEDSIKEEFNKLLIKDKIMYAGWATAEDSYRLFNIANIVCFPGRHSVYWEQTVGMGLPLLVKYWDGMEHIDFDGNLMYLSNDSANEIMEKTLLIYNNDYLKMKTVAESYSKKFLYSKITKQSIEYCEES